MQRDFFKISEVKAVYFPDFKLSDQPSITRSDDAWDIFYQNWEQGTIQHSEAFYVLMLSRSNQVLGIAKISQGGLSGTVADPKVIFQRALIANASSIVLAHNHPSGNTQPSDNDIELTKKLVKAGEMLEINVLDHLIITVDRFYSFADEGLI